MQEHFAGLVAQRTRGVCRGSVGIVAAESTRGHVLVQESARGGRGQHEVAVVTQEPSARGGRSHAGTDESEF